MKQPTITTLVLEVLRAQDDFLSRDALMKFTGCNADQVSAATHHLRKRHAIDCVIEPDGRAWWYALPPENDNRLFHIDERTPESKPRNRKRKTKLEII